MRDLYIKNGQGFVVVYSITNQQSFHDIRTMRDQIFRVKVRILVFVYKKRKYTNCFCIYSKPKSPMSDLELNFCLMNMRNFFCLPNIFHFRFATYFLPQGTDQVPILLVGNKCDLAHQRQVRTEDGSALAEFWSCPFAECSAKSAHNVNQVFAEIVREINYVQTSRSKQGGGCCSIS